MQQINNPNIEPDSDTDPDEAIDVLANRIATY